MTEAWYRTYVPSIPETAFDRAALTLLDLLSPGTPATAVFGHPDCPPGSALVEPIACCWYFRKGAASIIERLSLGAANAWRVTWICEPGSAAPPDNEDLPPPSRRPWFVRYPEVELTVFPTDIDAVLHGDTGLARIPAGTTVARLAYSPKGMRSFIPGNRTYAVAHAFTGFDVLFGCMDQAESHGLPLPEYFLGDAPEKRMCHFLKHVDFDVIDNGDIGATVFAPVDRVRTALDRHQERAARLLERANRESARR